ncbi:uncharacterized protein LOC117170738 [Belonocnema kinseyi]|uniref:uncharacterized protein LOC117170738 n=1 Tax=Belonocnema kinseyi TaxID=2817044 RepID=UPI00143D0020|nr:uncharacterized protein LOC117170738 [Belonocnema kinseyi]
MKGVIFLLCLCASQTVLAFFILDLYILRAKSIKKMDGIVKKLHKDVEAAIKDGRTKGLNEVIDECREYYRNLEELYNNRLNMQIKFCYTLADSTSDIKYAERCYAENIAEIETGEKKERLNTIECFQRHYAAQFGLGEGQHPQITLREIMVSWQCQITVSTFLGGGGPSASSGK